MNHATGLPAGGLVDWSAVVDGVEFEVRVHTAAMPQPIMALMMRRARHSLATAPQ
jgi:hypothetical protein